MPAKNTESRTLICASAPGKLPTIARDSRTSRSVMPPTFIRLAVSRKNGTASRMNELNALKVSCTRPCASSRGSMKYIGTHARPSANATGTRSSISPKKMPNRISAAAPGLSTPPGMQPPWPCGPSPRGGATGFAAAVRRSCHLLRCRSAVTPEQHADRVGHMLALEQQPGEPGDRPRDVDHPQRQFGQLGTALPCEGREQVAAPHEDQCEAQDAESRCDAHRGVGPRRQPWPDVDLEVRAVAHADHCADHDHPDEQETRHLLGPDVARDQLGVARED